ncbi:TPA: YSIRK signal domain/LPXTG anchor domain surface protein, partial [Streptococcus suis]
GKNSEVTVTPGTDQDGNSGQTITIVKPDGSRETTFIRDGKDGVDGKDGKSPLVEQIEVREGDKVIGTTIIIKDGDGQEISRQTILNGRDGKNSEVTVTPGTDQDGNTGQTITIVKPDGSRETTFIRDGKDGRDGVDGKDGRDGKSPLVEQVEVREGDKVIGTTIIIKDGDGNEVSRQTILNGVDGKNGADGKSAEVTVTPGTDQNGNPGQTITIVKPDGT